MDMNNRDNVSEEVTLDFKRDDRLGFGEAILCGHKTDAQLTEILRQADEKNKSFLITRVAAEQVEVQPPHLREQLDYDPVSRTAYFKAPAESRGPSQINIVTAGSSDIPVSRECLRTLNFYGYEADTINDVGVAGIWRLFNREEEIKNKPIVIAVAGMDAALVSVLGGFVQGLVVAVPTSTGYGVSNAGETALHSALASCAPGVVCVNIDNGYGAAMAAIRCVNLMNGESQSL